LWDLGWELPKISEIFERVNTVAPSSSGRNLFFENFCISLFSVDLKEKIFAIV
jgi:hypothetical protein